jgi:hypothetical protein
LPRSGIALETFAKDGGCGGNITRPNKQQQGGRESCGR